jgi:hypothetical protein
MTTYGQAWRQIQELSMIVFECEVCEEIFKAEPERSICGVVLTACTPCVQDHLGCCADCTAQERDALDD